MVAVTGWLVWPGTAPQPAPGVAVPEVGSAPAAVAPAAVDPAASRPAEVAPATAAPAVVSALPMVPRFDLVRVEPDGSATVAGRATPGAVVSLRVDGIEVMQATADGQGSFATLFSLPASAAPRLLTLAVLVPDGVPILGPDTVALAATAPKPMPEVALPDAPATIAVSPDVPPLGIGEAGVTAVDANMAPPAALLVTEGGVKVLQPGAQVSADLAANVSIDTISYAPDGAVQLGGRGVGAAFVRLYLDGAEAATAQVAPDGQWAAVLADVAPGIYTLRADQIGTDGKVTSRFETPFKRETLEALAAAATAETAVPATVATATAATETATPETAAPEAAPSEPVAMADPAPMAAAAPVAEATTSVQTGAAPVEPAATAPAVIGAPAPDAVPAQASPAVRPAAVTVTVQPGFTLWGIAQERFGDGVLYVQVFEANKDKIKDPDLIYPGQIFTMPAAP